MYFRLQNDWCLRGWIGFPYALVHLKNKQPAESLSQKDFSLLLLCDGETELEKDFFTPEEVVRLSGFIQRGIVETGSTPFPLSSVQYYFQYSNYYLSNIQWSITGHCNYRCRHCLMDAPHAPQKDLSTEEALSVIRQLAQCGIPSVDLTGGEPFVRKDIWRLIDACIEAGITIRQIYTNGSLFTEQIVSELLKRNLKPEISISFDGIGWHDWMRGVSGAESAAFQALKLAQTYGFSTNVEVCLFKGNLSVIRETVNTLAKYGVTLIKFGYVSDSPLWQKNADGNQLAFSQMIAPILEYIPQYFEDGMPVPVIFNSIVSLYPDPDSYKIHPMAFHSSDSCLNAYLCNSARCSGYISSEGRLIPCMPMAEWHDQSIFQKLSDSPLQTQLSDSPYMRYINTRIKELFRQNTECGTCTFRYQCGGGCRAHALLEGTHDFMGPDRNLCLLWKGGYVTRIEQTIKASIALYWKQHPQA